MDKYIPQAGDFERAERTEGAHGLSRPSLSYWQDAWIRLKKNKQAILSLAVTFLLIAFVLIGPFIWTVDPATQDLGRISQPPSLGGSALVIGEMRQETLIAEGVAEYPAADPDELVAPFSISVVGLASTLGVHIKWEPVLDSSGYTVYRSNSKPKNANSLGIPIADLDGGNKISFFDQLKLHQQPYYYSVVAKNSLGEESKNYITKKITVSMGLSLEDATAIDPNAVAGGKVKMSIRPFGTDYLGRDVLARLMQGGRVSLFIGFVGPIFYILIGIIYGGLSGYIGGRFDMIMMRIADFVVALPFLLFMILFYVLLSAAGVGGSSGITPILIAMIILFWPGTARLVRGQVLQIREEGYVSAAKLLGARPLYLIMRHMIPNTMGVILVTITFAIPSAIFLEAFLSFIGMGVKPPTASWGAMSFEGVKTMTSSPHELFLPAIFIGITTLVFNILGDGLRDALDARMRSRE